MSEEVDFGGVLEETEDCPVKTTIENIDLNLESPVTILVTKFSNKTQLIITGMYILYTSSGKCHGINFVIWFEYGKSDKFFLEKAVIYRKLTITCIFEL